MHFALVRCKRPSADTTALMVMTVKTIAMPVSLRVEHLCELRERLSSASKFEKANKSKSRKMYSISATIQWPILSNKNNLVQQLVKRPLQGKAKLIRISTLCRPILCRPILSQPRLTDGPCTA